MNIVAGIDIGSTTTKVVIMRENIILGSKISSTGTNCKKTVKLTRFQKSDSNVPQSL